jgi:hypothetical protein
MIPIKIDGENIGSVEIVDENIEISIKGSGGLAVLLIITKEGWDKMCEGVIGEIDKEEAK